MYYKNRNSGTKYGGSRKYGNKPVHKSGKRFDSKKEMKRHHELELLERAGEISGLSCQVKFLFPLRSMKNRQLYYVADFVYADKEGNQVVEDVKSEATRKLAVFTYKWALMKHFHNIEVRIV